MTFIGYKCGLNLLPLMNTEILKIIEIIPRNKDGFDSKKSTHSPRGGVIEKQEVHGNCLSENFVSKRNICYLNFSHLSVRDILRKTGS